MIKISKNKVTFINSKEYSLLHPSFYTTVYLYIQVQFGSAFAASRLQKCAFQLLFFFLSAANVDFSTVNSARIYCLETHKYYFLTTFSLKIGPMILFTYLKIILLQCFQFSIFSFSKISSIQTDLWSYTFEGQE